VTPSPRALHQRAVWALYNRFYPYVRTHRLGLVGLAPSDLDLESGQSVQPDLFLVSLRHGREPIEWSEFGVPLLIAEVLSPSTAFSDRTTKRRRYQRSRVWEYWIVDIHARVVERWRPDDGRPEILSERLEWDPDSAAPSLVIDLAEYFREVWAEN
jgi:Uma2 family endonuclease